MCVAKKERNIDKFIVRSEGSQELYSECVEAYIDYYDRRGKFYKKLYYFLSILRLTFVAGIPIVECISGFSGEGWIAVSLSSGSILCESLIGLFKAKNKWLSYRNTCDRLLREQRMYMLGSDYYSELDEEKRLKEYVRHIELIIQEENIVWKEYMKQQGGNDKK